MGTLVQLVYHAIALVAYATRQFILQLTLIQSEFALKCLHVPCDDRFPVFIKLVFKILKRERGTLDQTVLQDCCRMTTARFLREENLSTSKRDETAANTPF